MDGESLKKIRANVSLHIKAIIFDRYGQNIPIHLIDDSSQTENPLNTIEEFRSFKGDPDLQDLFEVFHRMKSGDYGRCMFCRKQIDIARLKENPTRRFCDACEKKLDLANNAREADHLLSIY